VEVRRREAKEKGSATNVHVTQHPKKGGPKGIGKEKSTRKKWQKSGWPYQPRSAEILEQKDKGPPKTTRLRTVKGKKGWGSGEKKVKQGTTKTLKRKGNPRLATCSKKPAL